VTTLTIVRCAGCGAADVIPPSGAEPAHRSCAEQGCGGPWRCGDCGEEFTAYPCPACGSYRFGLGGGPARHVPAQPCTATCWRCGEPVVRT
jgi:hypothetical protein